MNEILNNSSVANLEKKLKSLDNDFQLEITLNSIRFASPSSEVTVEWKEKNKTFSRVYKPWNQEIEQLELETL